jgi:hypothetical protein
VNPDEADMREVALSNVSQVTSPVAVFGMLQTAVAVVFCAEVALLWCRAVVSV